MNNESYQQYIIAPKVVENFYYSNKNSLLNLRNEFTVVIDMQGLVWCHFHGSLCRGPVTS